MRLFYYLGFMGISANPSNSVERECEDHFAAPLSLPMVRPSADNTQLMFAEIVEPDASDPEYFARHVAAIDRFLDILHFHPRWSGGFHDSATFSQAVLHLLTTGDRITEELQDSIAGADRPFKLKIESVWLCGEGSLLSRRVSLSHIDSDSDDEDLESLEHGDTELEYQHYIDQLSLNIEYLTDGRNGLRFALQTHGICDGATKRSWDKFELLVDEIYGLDLNSIFSGQLKRHSTQPIIRFELPDSGFVDALWLDLPPTGEEDPDSESFADLAEQTEDPVIIILEDPADKVLKALGEYLSVPHLSEVVSLSRKEFENSEEISKAKIAKLCGLGVSTLSLTERIAIEDIESAMSAWIILNMFSPKGEVELTVGDRSIVINISQTKSGGDTSFSTIEREIVREICGDSLRGDWHDVF